MELTRKTLIGNGSTTLYNVNFNLGYIDTDYVFVYLDGNEKENQLQYVWRNSNQIELNQPVEDGVKFYIRRVIPRDMLVNNYSNGALLRETNLNNSYLQALMILEEVQDGFIAVDDEFRILAKIVIQQNLDMSGYQINNLASPTEDSDAVNKAYLNARLQAGNATSNELTLRTVLIAQGFSGDYGFFSTGFEYSQIGDIGIDTDDNIWIYIGEGMPNKVVPAGTVPSVEGGYERVTFNKSSQVLNDDGTTAQDTHETTLSLGTASQANVTTSSIDTTSNAVMKTGDGGILSPRLQRNAYLISGDFLESVKSLPTGFYGVFKPNLTSNIPPGLNDRAVVTVRRYGSTDTYISLIDNKGREMSISRWNSNWGSWSVNVTDNNFNSLLAGAMAPVSFTPVLSGGTTAGEYNPTIASGMSYKIGNLVTVFVSFQNTTVITQGTGVIQVSGFPEQVSYNNAMFYAATSAVYFQNVKSGGVVKYPIVKASRGQNSALLYTQDTTGGDDFPAIRIEEVLDGQTRFGFTVTYMAQ